MRARNQLGITYKLQCTFKSALDAHFCQACGHLHGPFGPSSACLAQTLHQFGVIGIKPQAYDVNGVAYESDGDLRARQVLHAQCFCCRRRPALAAYFVVVS